VISYGRQSIAEADVAAVIETLDSGWLTQGPAVEKFERALEAYCNTAHAIVHSSATAALHTTCLALGLGAGDILWTSAISFVASANCGAYCGATVDFVDIDPATRNISVSALEKKLQQARKNNCLPKIVVAVHFAGLPCDLEAIYQLSRLYNFAIIEDAAHAIGSRYQHNPVGHGKFSAATIFSFHPVKNLTTGEGGAVLTPSAQLAEKIRLLANHGIERDSNKFVNDCRAPCHYEQHYLGFNYRMSDLQAALGYSQLQRLDSFVARRNYLVDRYNVGFSKINVKTPVTSVKVAWHIYVIEMPLAEARDLLYQRLKAKNIFTNVHYIPIYRQPYYAKQTRFHEADFPASENYYSRALTLPLFVELTDAQQDEIIAIVKDAV
jgi:UDP-4-amino-4,6-dideoxy-N-acetyl-beta-L-altrosamine transaminase